MCNGISILVVEDDNDISNMICDLLRQNGYNAKPAYSGTDDYIVKPFNNDELLARIEAQLRRYSQSSTIPNEINKITYKDITIDTETYSVQVGNIPISLTKRELLILELLMKYPKKVFTKSNLYENVWNDEFFGDENTINVHISNIRSKLARANPSQEYIQTVWGIGFKMSE